MDSAFIKQALKKHVPLIKFRYVKDIPHTKLAESNMNVTGTLGERKLWFINRPLRPILTESEVEAINVHAL